MRWPRDSPMKSVLLFLALVFGGLSVTWLFVISIAPTCPVLSIETSKTESEENKLIATSQESHGRNTRQNSATARATPLNNPKPTSDSPKAKYVPKQKPWPEHEWWGKFLCDLKISDVAIVYLTFCLVIVGGFQAWFLYRTDTSTRMSAEAAKASADAVVAQLRAYIGMRVKEGIPPSFDARTGPYLVIEVRNTGQTPAFNMIYWIRAALGPADYKGPLPDAEDGDDVPPHPMTLAPGSSVDIAPASFELTAEAAASFAEGVLAAYIYGEIEYSDAFGSDRFHKFRYTFKAEDIAGPIAHVRLSQDGNIAN